MKYTLTVKDILESSSLPDLKIKFNSLAKEESKNNRCNPDRYSCIGCANCVDCSDCNYCRSCTHSSNLNYCDSCSYCKNCQYCQNCNNCTSCFECKNCINCKDCYFSTYQNNKQYVVFNCQLTLEQYNQFKKRFNV